MNYRTCLGCASYGKPCDTRDDLKRSLAGLGVTSIKWKCKARVPFPAPGEPVLVLTAAYYPEYDEHIDPPMAHFPAHAIGWAGSKVLVYIEKGAVSADDPDGNYPFDPKGNGYCKVPISRVKPRDGQHEPVCEFCLNLTRTMGHAEYCNRAGKL